MAAVGRPKDLASLSGFLGFAPQHLFYLVQLSDRMYFDFEIKKANGGSRRISAPRTELKGVQKEILRKILEPIPVHDNCMAYVKHRGVIQAAKKISGHKAVLCVDITNFFPSITSKRVFGFFRRLGYNDKTSFLLTKLTTYRGRLCQGAPTSPYLSNLIFHQADRQLNGLASSWSISYVRYSDDIFFYAPKNFRHKKFLNIIEEIIRQNGFSLNKKKTKYFRRNSPRYTLGLQTMGSAPQLSRSHKRVYRAAFYKASSNWTWARKNASRLSGMAEWYRLVYGPDEKYREFQAIIRNVSEIRFHEVYGIS